MINRTSLGATVLLLISTTPAHAQCERPDEIPASLLGEVDPEKRESLQALRDAFTASLGRLKERTEALSQEENQRIRAVVDGSTNRVFFIDVFGGYMPVPNRFAVRGDGELRSTATGVHRGARTAESPEELSVLNGAIRFGPRSDLELPSDDEDQASGIELCGKAAFARYGLNVQIRDYPNSRWASIYNDEQFLSVMDTNRGLWEAMLDVWFALNGGRGE